MLKIASRCYSQYSKHKFKISLLTLGITIFKAHTVKQILPKPLNINQIWQFMPEIPALGRAGRSLESEGYPG